MGALGKAAFRLRHAGAIVRWVLVYYSMSIAFVATSKSVLLRIPDFPWTLSFLQCSVAAGCSRAWISSRATGIGERQPDISPRQWRLLLAGSLTCWLGFACANVACAAMNASLVETIKATTPIPQVIIAAYLGEGWAPAHIRRALAVIVAGVMLASFADSSACARGIAVSLAMNVSFALADNIVKFSYTLPDRLDPSTTWYRSAQLGALFAAPAALAEVALCAPHQKVELTLAMQGSAMLLVLLSGCAFFLYNQSICELLGQVPISMFALLGSVRRAVTIAALMIIFQTEVTVLNAGGLCIVALGFTYFLAQQQKQKEEEDEPRRSPSVLEKPSRSDSLARCFTSATLAPSSDASSTPRSRESAEDVEWLVAGQAGADRRTALP